MVDRRIVCAALRLGDALVLGPRHFDQTMRATIRALKGDDPEREWMHAEQGFVDQFGDFLTRREAFTVADQQRQIRRLVGSQHTWDRDSGLDAYFAQDLYSENLY